MGQRGGSGPEPVPVPADDTVVTRLWERASSGSSREILRYPFEGGWAGLSWTQLADRVRDIAAGLVASGIEPGDRVALLSDTRVEWTVADLAILSAGAVVVPIPATSPVQECAWIVADSGCRLAITGTAAHASRLEAARDAAGALEEELVIDDGGLVALADRAQDGDRAAVDERSARLTGSDLCSIAYTQGATGDPKGCMLTHHNMVWTARQAAGALRALLSEEDSMLLSLPLAHVLGRLAVYVCAEADVPVGYARSGEALRGDLASFQPSVLLTIPHVLGRLFACAQREAAGARRRGFDLAVSAGVAWSSAVDAGREPGFTTQAKKALADKAVYAGVREGLGGRVRWCLSGGAPLPSHLAHFFHAAGIPVLEGYGLTETTGSAAWTRPGAVKVGTVGQPLPGVEMRIDGAEVRIRGENVFTGYWNDEAASAEVLENGWLRSGDLGEIDDAGRVRLTGRRDELLVAAGGRTVAPTVLEQRLAAHPLVSQAMVVGDDRPFLGALVTLDPDELAAVAAEYGLSGDLAALGASDPVRAAVQRAVDDANGAVSRAASIRGVVVLERVFSAERGELTPTCTLRRRVIEQHFASAIEGLYRR